MDTFAVLARNNLDEDLPLIRELMSYDCLCPSSCEFERDELGAFKICRTASPLHWSRQVEWPWILKQGQFLPSHRVLDVGSGWSVLKYAVANRCAFVDVIDNDTESIVKAKKSTEIVHRKHNIQHHFGDARELSGPDDYYDRVVCCSVLEHIPDNRMVALEEMLRVLRPGGVLLLTMDVVLQGKPTTNFYMGLEEASKMMLRLGIFSLDLVQTKENPIRAAWVDKEEAVIIVLMIKHTKPS